MASAFRAADAFPIYYSSSVVEFESKARLIKNTIPGHARFGGPPAGHPARRHGNEEPVRDAARREKQIIRAATVRERVRLYRVLFLGRRLDRGASLA